MENFSEMKTRYDQLVLTLGQKIDSLNNAVEKSKAEMTAETVMDEKCRNRVNKLGLSWAKLKFQLS